MPIDAIVMIQDSVVRAVDALEREGEPKDQPLVVPVEDSIIALTELAEFNLPKWVDTVAKAAGYPAGVIDPRTIPGRPAF